MILAPSSMPPATIRKMSNQKMGRRGFVDFEGVDDRPEERYLSPSKTLRAM
jgi:hypothetical protein